MPTIDIAQSSATAATLTIPRDELQVIAQTLRERSDSLWKAADGIGRNFGYTSPAYNAALDACTEAAGLADAYSLIWREM